MMAYNLKQQIAKPERFSGGHRMCAGCGAPVAVRGVLRALEPADQAVIGCATGCLEVSTFLYPYTAWQDSFISAFENAGATVGGVEAAYRALKKNVARWRTTTSCTRRAGLPICSKRATNR